MASSKGPNFEEYWGQTRRKWAARVVDPYGATAGCGFCRFSGARECVVCPVFKVYGGSCNTVASVAAYGCRFDARVPAEELSALAQAVVWELDDKKEELIAAMRELREEQDEGNCG